MALIWADFPSGQKGLYGQTESYMLNGIWASFEGAFASNFISIQNDPDPEIGADGYVLRFNQNGATGEWSDVYARLTYPAAVDTAGLTFRMWMSEYPNTDSASDNPEWEFRNISNTLIARVRVGASGQFIVHNSAGTVLGTSDPAVVTTNAYEHVETKVVRHASAGTLEIKVNGITKLSLTGLALGSNDIVNVCLGQDQVASGRDSLAVYFKDIIFWDGLGDHINDFLGAVAVYDLIPDGDQSLNWTPSTGSTGYDLVDEGDTGPNDADYVSADNTQTTPTSFTMTDLPPDVISVRAVMPIGRQVKTDGGTCTTLMGVSPDNTNWDDGTDRPITVANTYYWDVSYLSPATASSWTPAEVDDMRFRIDRTS